MPFSIKLLLKKTFHIIQKDKLILVPYLIFFLSAQILHDVLPLLNLPTTGLQPEPILIGFSWVTEMVFKSITLVMAGILYVQPYFSLKEVLKTSLKKLPVVLIGTGIFVVPIIFVTQYMYKDIPNELGLALVGLFILAIFLIPLSLVLEFIPMPILLKEQGLFKSIQSAFSLVKIRLKQVIIVTSMTLCIVLFTSIISVLITPSGLEAQVSPELHALGFCVEAIIQAIGYCFIYTMLAVFYLDCQKTGEILVEV